MNAAWATAAPTHGTANTAATPSHLRLGGACEPGRKDQTAVACSAAAASAATQDESGVDEKDSSRDDINRGASGSESRHARARAIEQGHDPNRLRRVDHPSLRALLDSSGRHAAIASAGTHHDAMTVRSCAIASSRPARGVPHSAMTPS